MTLTFDGAFENTALKNQSLAQEIEGLKRFITPDHELLDGHDMIGYRLERENASVAEIKQMLEKDKNTLNTHRGFFKFNPTTSDQIADELVNCLERLIVMKK